MIKQPQGWDRWALLLLQVLLGVLFVPHGYQKLFGAFGGGGTPATVAYFQKLGFLPIWAWVVMVLEFFGGLSVLFGFLTRFWASLFVIEMIVATIKVNWARGFVSPQIGWEVPLAYGGIALALVLMGPGFLSVDRAIGLEEPAF
jgi:putative oxidoreductase